MQENFTQNNDNPLKRIDWFSVCYWAAAGVQVVGSYNVFGTIGGSWLHAIAGALCLELFILALNAYGVKQSGKWMGLVCLASLVLIGASAMFQVADLLSHPVDATLAEKFGAGLYAVLRVTVPVAPSVAMAGVTIIKFVDARRNQGVPLAEQLQAAHAQLHQTEATLATVAHQADEAVRANAHLVARVDGLETQRNADSEMVARLRADHSHELREVARLATAQRVTQPIAQLASGGMTWEAAVAQLERNNEPVTPTALAQLTRKHKASASRWLKAGAK